ncbi:MAG: hypothetical protein WAJ85_02330 [Candidatus Baltobacteraceae bacterium]|jgi:hypothetical protein
MDSKYSLFYGETAGCSFRRLYARKSRPGKDDFWILASREARKNPPLDLHPQPNGTIDPEGFALRNFPTRLDFEKFCEEVKGWKNLDKEGAKDKPPRVLRDIEPWND